jgi:hypothetical protein
LLFGTKVRYTARMLIQTPADTMTKFAQMGDATVYEPAGDQPQQERRRVPYQSQSLAECITNVATPQGKRPILKTMVTTIHPRLKRCFYRSTAAA